MNVQRFTSMALGGLGAGLSVVGFLVIVPDGASSGGGGYILFLLAVSFVLSFAAKGDIIPVAIGVLASSAVMLTSGVGGDNDGLQLLLVPWLLILALLVMISAGAGRSAWLRLAAARAARRR